MQLVESVEGSAAAVVLALVSEGDCSAEDRAALYRRAKGLAVDVSRLGPWDALRDLVIGARRDALASNSAPAVRHAALDFIETMAQAHVVANLVDAVCGLGTLTPELEALLAAGGTQSIWTAATACRSASGSAATELKSFLCRLDAGVWEKATEEALARPAAEVSVVLPTIAQLEAPVARRLGYRLLQHHDERIRHRVLAFLLNLEPKDAGWRRLVHWSLASGDKEMADIARGAIVRLDPPDAELLAAALEGDGPTNPSGRLEQELRELASRCAMTPPGENPEQTS